MEKQVTSVIGEMPFLWLQVDDEPGTKSQRAYIERNSIGLLSNLDRTPCDPASPAWLGHQCHRPRVRQSGLWNQQHVEDSYDPKFLDVFSRLVDEQLAAGSKQ